ncbi:hypothetical protein JQC72_11850 [Polycladomyces sp. WAk]|uniref:Uncharacterized protein n=1 Tax=Polycladomyces zharkentensis TaxID=2807616 RepID=A0ABS2WKU8_9BACL|nr:hypothetical protein [Polycladomyces sp. WAk]MBN2910195.1 hypothetical protein [Polycladomyces sp. WAk]
MPETAATNGACDLFRAKPQIFDGTIYMRPGSGYNRVEDKSGEIKEKADETKKKKAKRDKSRLAKTDAAFHKQITPDHETVRHVPTLLFQHSTKNGHEKRAKLLFR